jgi:hypothetical protein
LSVFQRREESQKAEADARLQANKDLETPAKQLPAQPSTSAAITKAKEPATLPTSGSRIQPASAAKPNSESEEEEEIAEDVVSESLSESDHEAPASIAAPTAKSAGLDSLAVAPDLEKYMALVAKQREASAAGTPACSFSG